MERARSVVVVVSDDVLGKDSMVEVKSGACDKPVQPCFPCFLVSIGSGRRPCPPIVYHDRLLLHSNLPRDRNPTC